MSHLFLALAELQVLLGPSIAAVQAGKLANPGPWRPPEWRGPSLNALIVPAENGQSSPTIYVFDAVLKVEHQRELRRTEHPIQAAPNAASASITDHAFLLPARVVMEIAMSDAMAGFEDDMWDGGPTKSVSAFQQLTRLQKSRTLITLNTRLDTYTDMLVESILPCDTAKTLHGLSATVTFSKVYRASIKQTSSGLAASERPQTSQATPTGVVNALPPNAAVSGQFQAVGNTTAAKPRKFPSIPGAGKWSSINVLRLEGMFQNSRFGGLLG